MCTLDIRARFTSGLYTSKGFLNPPATFLNVNQTHSGLTPMTAKNP